MELVAVSSRPRRGVAALTAQEIERIRFFSSMRIILCTQHRVHLLKYDQILLSSWKPFEEGSGGICSILYPVPISYKVQYAAVAKKIYPKSQLQSV